jgi:hypothetical protein
MSILNYTADSVQGIRAPINGRRYPDPFLSYSSAVMPRTVSDALRWSEQLWLKNGVYAQALTRVIASFLTPIEVFDAGDKEKERYEKLLGDVLRVPSAALSIGRDFLAYGNSFSSLLVPFRRSLFCEHKKCRLDLPIERIDYKLSKSGFEWTCPICKKNNQAKRPIDRRISDETKARIKRWTPHNMKIEAHPITDDCVYRFDFDAEDRKKIQNGDKFMLQYMPWEMAEACLEDKLFEFYPDAIYHMRDDSLSGLNLRGWGLSTTVSNFSQAYYIQMAKLFNELLMLEYMVPFRVVSPAAAKGVDPLMQPMNEFTSNMKKMFSEHRINPGGWNFVPHPIEYQSLGAEGMQLTAYDHIKEATDELLNAAGVPAELYRGTVAFQALPSALRLFHQMWPHVSSQLNSWLAWLMRSLSINFNWAQAGARFTNVTMADDIERRQWLFQLMAANKVSDFTALAPIGVDPDKERERIYEQRRQNFEAENRFMAEQQQQVALQQQLSGQNMNMAGSPAPVGGAVGGGSPGVGTGAGMGLDEVAVQAEQEAARLLSMPYEARKSQMIKMKHSNETLHALVKSKMESMRTQAQQMGGQAVIQQMASQGAPVAG